MLLFLSVRYARAIKPVGVPVTYMQTHTHTHIHTHILTYVHAYIHVCVHMLPACALYFATEASGAGVTFEGVLASHDR
jgi:hypothetical protein